MSAHALDRAIRVARAFADVGLAYGIAREENIRILQFRWSDEPRTPWRSYGRVDPNRSDAEQLAQMREEFAAIKLFYGHGYDIYVRIEEAAR